MSEHHQGGSGKGDEIRSGKGPGHQRLFIGQGKGNEKPRVLSRGATRSDLHLKGNTGCSENRL